MLGICKLGRRRSENEKCPLCEKNENEFNLALKCTKMKKKAGLTLTRKWNNINKQLHAQK
jgi:hypothetical protein